MSSPYRTTCDAGQAELNQHWERVMKSLKSSKLDLLKISIKEVITTAYAQGLKSKPLENNVNRDLERLYALVAKEFESYEKNM